MPFPLNNIIKEACVETLDQAITAQKRGAHRIELCGRLDLGGITPSEQLIKDCIKHLDIPIKVMIRPRGGNFIYTEEEIKSMIADIELCKDLGIPEFVMGALLDDNSIDIDNMIRLSANVGHAPITFHKAIDELPNFEKSIQQLKEIPNVKSILTSGLASTAKDGIPVLKKMVQLCGDQIAVIVAGKVTDHNIEDLHTEIDAKEYHGRKIVGQLPD